MKRNLNTSSPREKNDLKETIMDLRKAIVVGCGFAGLGIWLPILEMEEGFSLIGVVDLLEEPRKKAKELIPGIWTASNVKEIPDTVSRDTVVFVITPDHYPVIVDLVELGFKNLVVEKPLVSHLHEIPLLQELIQKENLKIYTIDHYYAKALPLEYILGRMRDSDPRIASLSITGDHFPDKLPGCLGKIEGVSSINIEAGNLGLEYILDGHLWVMEDPDIGGIIRDLGPHTLGPLVRCGLINPAASVLIANLFQFTEGNDGFTSVKSPRGIEMLVHALLVNEGITLDLQFGKAWFPGKIRSLSIRAEKGTFYAGLARGDSSVVMTSDKRTTRISLRATENQTVVEEAKLFFDDRLPGFDGNMTSAITALQLGEEIRETYYNSLK